jgi:hypothetical protein
VHDGNKSVSDLRKIFGAVSKTIEQILKSLKVFKVLIGLLLGNLDLLLELAERSGIGALVLFKELENFLDAL